MKHLIKIKLLNEVFFEVEACLEASLVIG